MPKQRRSAATAVLLLLALVPASRARGAVRPPAARAGREAAPAAPASPGDRSWLLSPRVFPRLSAGGRREALYLNGLAPARPAPGAGKRPAAARPTPLGGPLAPRQNVRVDDPSLDQAGHTHSETSVAVRGSSILVGFNDASDDTSGYGFSTDGGATFAHRRLPPPLGGYTFGDPVVAFGPTGEAYYATLLVTSGGDSAIGVAKSTDGGATFGVPVDASLPAETSADSQDKPWMAVDAGATSSRNGSVYVTWTDFVSGGYTTILFSRSLDGGASYSTPVNLSPVDTVGVQNSSIAVAPNGDLYVAFEDGHFSPDGITMLRSTDGGTSFTPATVATFPSLSVLTGGGSVRASSAPSIAADASGVHVVWAAPAADATLDRSDVFYAHSTDGGKTFGAPRKLNDDGTPTSQAFPAVAVTADGAVAVRWADRRDDARGDAYTHVRLAISRDGGATFGRSFRVSDADFAYGPVEAALASGYHGDYDGIAADSGNFYLAWGDERGSAPDVYFAFVPESFDGGTPDFGVAPSQAWAPVKAGGTATLDVATVAENDFGGALALSASTLPASGISASLPATVAAGGTATLTVAAGASTAPGDYLVTVGADAAGARRTASLRVTVYGAALDPPRNVTATPGFTGGGGVHADPAGNLHLVYEDDSAAVLGEDVFYRRSTDGGLTFSAPLRLNGPGSFGIDAEAAADGSGRVVAVWTGRSGSETLNRVYVARSTDGGASFSAAAAVTPASQHAEYPALAIGPNGAVLVAYYDASGSSPVLDAIRSSDGGASFGAPAGVNDPGSSDLTRPGLAFDSKGKAYLVYTSQGVSGTSLVSAVGLAVAPAGQAFGAPKAVSSTSIANAFGPDVAVGPDDGVAVVFYDRFTTSAGAYNRDVVLVRSTDGGTTFSPQVNVSNDAGQSYFPTVAIEPGGAIDVAWEDSDGNDQTDAFLARSTDGGKTFTSPRNVSADQGLSGSAANPLESVGGSGRVALAAAGGAVLVSYLDDSAGNPDVFLSRVVPSSLSNLPPSVAIARPSAGASFEAGVAVTFAATGSDPDGDALTYAWTFGDGGSASGASVSHAFAAPGAYTAAVTASDERGGTASASVTVTVTAPSATGAGLLIPVVVEAAGVAGSRYQTEVTLASRAASPTEVLLAYTASAGGGSGFARLTLAPGEQRILPGVLAWLRARGLGIPDDGATHAGTLLATFSGVTDAASVFAGARTFTADPAGSGGTFGTFYAAVPTASASLVLFGLQQNASQRSNLAVVNGGPEAVTLRVTLVGPNGEDLGVLPDQALGPWGWAQFNQPLAGKAESGRAVVTRVSGGSPFSAYAVLNDAVTSDGSFLPPLLPGDASGAERLVPVVLDAQGLGARFRTELTLANLTSAPLPLTLAYTAAPGFGSGSGSVSLTLAAGEQRIVPDAVAFLRTSLPIPADGSSVAGSLLVSAPVGTAASSLAVGARTFVPLAPSGSYGLFYTGLSRAESASSSAAVFGLQQSAAQRSNLALVNRGDAGDAITLRVTLHDASGATLGSPVERTLAPGAWTQIGQPLAGTGAASGWATVEKVSGSSLFAAYGVLNDNATSDGSYLPMK